MQQPAFEAQAVVLPAMLLAGLRRAGDAAGGAEHWQQFRQWLRDTGTQSCDAQVLAIAYTPPAAFGAERASELCVPVAVAPALATQQDVVVRTLGGRFVLASGGPADIPSLMREARSFATARGLAFERGSIAIYRRGVGGDGVRVDAGVRIHE